ncbi:hypothetical protein WJX74_001566 [Apatococcus lobatus]|uniref:HMG box domain-containing protein n=1 Tax=Apatococcus lobatus TaxID=904363 RepID=A0AAW1QKE3_9CHLO
MKQAQPQQGAWESKQRAQHYEVTALLERTLPRSRSQQHFSQAGRAISWQIQYQFLDPQQQIDSCRRLTADQEAMASQNSGLQEDLDAELLALERELAADNKTSDEVNNAKVPSSIKNDAKQLGYSPNKSQIKSRSASDDVQAEASTGKPVPEIHLPSPSQAVKPDSPSHDKWQPQAGSIAKVRQTPAVESAPATNNDRSAKAKAVPSFKGKKRQLDLGSVKPFAASNKNKSKDSFEAEVKPGAPAGCVTETVAKLDANVSAKAAKSSKRAPAKPKAAKKEQPKKDKIPRGKNAFMHFVCAKRSDVAAENHDLKLGEVSKKLGDMWKLLTEEEKQPYKDLAAAEKEQLQAAQPAGTIQESNQAVSVKESKAPSEPRAKTAYNIFCQARRAYLKAESPEANSTDITRLLATTWKTMGAEERKPYIMQHKEEEAALNIQKPDVCQHHNESDLEEDRSHPAPIALCDKQPGGFPQPADVNLAAPDKSITHQNPAKTPAKIMRQHCPAPAEEDDEQARMDVDWEAYPAQIILAQTMHASGAKLLVKRKGCSMEEYGLCDMAAAKRQRLTGEGAVSPLSLEMLEEWEAYQRACRMAVFNCTEDGEMDLDDLPEDSPLQACAFLGKLRETDYPLSKLVKRKHEQSDTMMRVPMLGLSFAVQRMIQAQAVEKDGIIADLQEKLEQLKGEIGILEMAAKAHPTKASCQEVPEE